MMTRYPARTWGLAMALLASFGIQINAAAPQVIAMSATLKAGQ